MEIRSNVKKEEIKYSSKAFEGCPEHVAVICDGNRRWAKQRGLSVFEGHMEGADNVIRLAKRAAELGVKVLTVWVGDTKNLIKRKEEGKDLVRLFLYYCKKFRDEYLNEQVRFRHIGNRDTLPAAARKIISALENSTKDKSLATLVVAFNYGGRDELVRAIRKIISSGSKPEDVNEESVSAYMDSADLGDPDMVIRTGKEVRLSGFMSWQCAPSELFFPDVLFPDFTPDVFESVVREFPKRNRRLGG